MQYKTTYLCCRVFNYGALGTLIGHELSHALDTTGRKLDKNGQLKKWWHNSDLDAYHKRTVCFEQEYNSLGVNGAITMSENIADNVGLHLSFKAYKNLREKALNKIVPHLESFTKEQLFFISYAQVYHIEITVSVSKYLIFSFGVKLGPVTIF